MIWDFKYLLSLVHFIKKCNISIFHLHIGLSALKVNGYDIKSGILYARNKINLICNSRIDVISGNFEAW
jgi:hypothetical protein